MLFLACISSKTQPLIILTAILLSLACFIFPLLVTFAALLMVFISAYTFNGTLFRFCLWNLGCLLWWYSPVGSLVSLCLLARFSFGVSFSDEDKDKIVDSQARFCTETMVKSRLNHEFCASSFSFNNPNSTSYSLSPLSPSSMPQRNTNNLFSMHERPYRIVEPEYKGRFQYHFNVLHTFKMKTYSTCSTCTKSSMSSAFSNCSTPTFMPEHSPDLFVNATSPSPVSVIDSLSRQMVDLTITSEADDSSISVSLFSTVLNQITYHLSRLYLGSNFHNSSHMRSLPEQPRMDNDYVTLNDNELTRSVQPCHSVTNEYSPITKNISEPARVKELTADELGDVLSSMMNTNMTLNDTSHETEDDALYISGLNNDAVASNLPQVSLDDIRRSQGQQGNVYSYHSNSLNSDVTNAHNSDRRSLSSHSNRSVATTVLYIDDQASL